MAQDPHRDDEHRDDEFVDTSHDFDMVTLFSSSNTDAELDCTNINNILQGEGIPSVVVGASTIPVLEFQVQVPRARLEEARRIIEDARAAGPEAAAEAEASSEENSGPK